MHTIEASRLSKAFRHPRSGEAVPVLTDVSLTADAGELLGIVGPSGSGKSTLLYCLAGLEPATSGTVSVLGDDWSRLSPTGQAKLYREHVGFVFQAYNLVGALSAGENIGLPARLAGKRPKRQDIEAVMEQLGLPGLYARMPHELSGGQQQRVAIARAVFTRPALVFADEPTGALDTRSGELIIETLQYLAASGSTVVLVTHNIEAAARTDRTLVLRDGQIAAMLTAPTAPLILAAMERPVTSTDSSAR